jgi:Phage tail lysozyme/Ig-like domain from next to BRCA1 gene
MAASRTVVLLALGSLALSFAGCSDSGGSREDIGQSAAALNTNDEPAFDYFVGKGLTAFQAAGIVGNLDQESNVDPTAVQSGGPGRGIAQWSTGGRWDTDTNDNAVWYAAKEGLSVWSLQLQLDFIWYELTTFSGYGLAALKATTNVTDATTTFETDFEGCGVCEQATRISYAQAVLAAYGSVDYAAQFVSQSFPFASTTLTMTAGQVIPSYIQLKNTGVKAWDSNTRIGTTQPRDRTSAFADSTWIAPNRPSAVKGTVAPGDTYKFTFDLAAPDKPGTYDEFFGVVEDGVAWFSDNGQGGPPDNQLEVKVLVVPSDAAPPDHDAGEAAHDSGASSETDGASHPETPPENASSGGCNAAGAPSASDGSWLVLGLLLSGGRARGGCRTRRDGRRAPKVDRP